MCNILMHFQFYSKHLVLILIASLLALTAPVSLHAAPSLAMPAAVFDAGRVMEGELVQHTFRVENDGDEALRILQVKPDCGCTTAEFDRVVGPGKEGWITLVLDTAGYVGDISRHTRVFTNDPSREMFVLEFKADVWRPISISRSYVIFKGKAGEKLSEFLDIQAEMEKPLALEALSFDLMGKVKYRIEGVEQGRHYRIHFENVPGPVERYHGTLKLGTNYPEVPEIEIRVRARFN